MSDRRDLLVEIGTEELPPKALLSLGNALADGLTGELENALLDFGQVHRFATPRRLAVRVDALAARQPDRETERRGPPVKVAFDRDGLPTKAAEKFAAGCGVAVDALSRIETPKGEWLMFRGIEQGAETPDLLPAMVQRALDRLPIPKRMRWGSSDAEFVRPVHWAVMLFGDEVVPATILDTKTTNLTRGHRFHAPNEIAINVPADYARLLEEKGWVIADFAVRRAQIRAGVNQLASELGGRALIVDPLLDEVTALVEWPVPLAGRFEERFLALPPEVLIATLQEHQRYFAIVDKAGKLMPWFITVSNIQSRDPDQVRAGNERVVLPRLSDAAFFWDTDRQRSLESRVADLDRVVFQQKLGSLGDKGRRAAALAAHLAGAFGAEHEQVLRAGLLCNCDLTTDMVGEFPELQGVMGRYYALHDGEHRAVAIALDEQYRPRFAGDVLPQTPAGRALAVGEKLDAITGIFGIGQKPTGTRDPFGLRRRALGVLRILIEGEQNLDLLDAIRFAVEQIPDPVDPDGLVDSIYEYMMERLRSYYLDDGGGGFSPGMFEAVMARRPERPLDFHHRIVAVRDFSERDAAASLAAANKRIANILRTATDRVPDSVNAGQLREPAETALYESLAAVRHVVAPLLEQGNYGEAMERLAALREPVDRFFDDVMVMCDDQELRINRLALLSGLRDLFLATADISRLQ